VLLYFVEGYLDTIEACSYQQGWPEKFNEIEVMFHKDCETLSKKGLITIDSEYKLFD